MASVNNRHVLASGVLHFVGSEVAETGTVPNARFRASTSSPPQSVTPTAQGDDFVFDINVDPGATYVGFIGVELGGRNHRIAFVVERPGELPAGSLYEVRYTITN